MYSVLIDLLDQYLHRGIKNTTVRETIHHCVFNLYKDHPPRCRTWNKIGIL